MPPSRRRKHRNSAPLFRFDLPYWKAHGLVAGVDEAQAAYAIGVGVVPHDEIDRINILQATYQAMRLALAQLIIQPAHVLVDGYPMARCPYSQTGIIDGDAQSACIAAASIVAKVTRDCIMEALDRDYPGYGFKQHKGYGTPGHLTVLSRLGPSTIHRRSFKVQLRLPELDVL